MKKIYDAVDRFCARNPRFGIPNLMRVVVVGNVIVYLLYMFTAQNNPYALSFLYFSLDQVLKGEIWRIITYIFIPMSGTPLGLLITLYFYYWIGSTLEREWGTAKFNLYYFSGVLLTVIGASIASLLSGFSFPIGGTEFVNLSMFLAFACLFPNAQVLLFFIIPVKMKWLAWIDAALFAYEIVTSALAGNWAGVALPVVALLNFAVFIYPEVKYMADRAAYQRRPQTVQFKKAVKQAQQTKGYNHKCTVCGKTDADHPDMQFRYCSKCSGYHCFCQDHIFNHVHFE